MFKYNNNTLPESISEPFVPYIAIHTYNTRNKHNLRPKQGNIALWSHIAGLSLSTLIVCGLLFMST